MTILSTQERKYETKTFRKCCEESSNLQFAVPGNAKLKLHNDYALFNESV